MPSRGRQYLTVEVKPSSRSSHGGSLTPSPSSPGKAVRFELPFKSDQRELNHIESWSLYNFELHARACSICFDPLKLYDQGRPLCPVGRGLALDVATHVHLVENKACSTTKDNHKHVPLIVPPEYNRVQRLLRYNRRLARDNNRSPPSPAEHHPVLARRLSPDGFVDSSSSRGADQPSLSPLHSRQRVRSPTPDSSTETSSTTTQRRGTVYGLDESSHPRGYCVEVREPERREQRHTARSTGLRK